MSLHNGIDTVGIATAGSYSKTYGSAAPGNIANLFATLGLLEDAPKIAVSRLFRSAIIRSVINRSSFGSKK